MLCTFGVEDRHQEAEQWPDLLAVDAHLHDALSALPEPKHLALREDRWSRADRMAWGERTLPDSPQMQVLFTPASAPRSAGTADPR